jgi:hypothetical protein
MVGRQAAGGAVLAPAVLAGEGERALTAAVVAACHRSSRCLFCIKNPSRRGIRHRKLVTPSKTVIAAFGQRLFFHVPKPVENQGLLQARYLAGWNGVKIVLFSK